MRSKAYGVPRIVFAACVVVALQAVAGAQIRILPPANDAAPLQLTSSGAPELASVLDRASRLEEQRRWGEAVALYEEALREHPSDESLTSRHTLAKIHYDLGRRYSDTSFLRLLSSLAERDVLALYNEVLVKIQSHYVSEPDWSNLVARGTKDIEVALSEPTFVQRNLAKNAQTDAASLRAQYAQYIRSATIRTRQDAVNTVYRAAQFAQQRLGISATAVMLEYTCGATGALDEYSAYLTGDQLNDVYSQIEGNFVGLGIELKASEGALEIVKVISGSPADRGGILPGDRILSVSGRSTAKLTTDQAADLLQGTEGSLVELTAASASGQARRIVLRREHVEVPSVDEVQILDPSEGIGYLRITCFQKTTSRDMDAALWKLHGQGMRSLIVDLRGNPGGLLTSSVEVADKFIEDGVIVSTRGRSTLEDYNYTAHRAGTWRVPLVVLIDGESASASEIFAGAIKDHQRGTIVGQRSYGKGSVQGIFPLTVGGAGVRLTTAKFYSPSGQAISHAGVMPKIIVQKAAKPIANHLSLAAASEDPVVAAGLQAARRQVAQR